MSRKQKDLEYVSDDGVHPIGFVVRVKNETSDELMTTGKWKRIADSAGVVV